jgi:hypothetical protein
LFLEVVVVISTNDAMFVRTILQLGFFSNSRTHSVFGAHSTNVRNQLVEVCHGLGNVPLSPNVAAVRRDVASFLGALSPFLQTELEAVSAKSVATVYCARIFIQVTADAAQEGACEFLESVDLFSIQPGNVFNLQQQGRAVMFVACLRDLRQRDRVKILVAVIFH